MLGHPGSNFALARHALRLHIGAAVTGKPHEQAAFDRTADWPEAPCRIAPDCSVTTTRRISHSLAGNELQTLQYLLKLSQPLPGCVTAGIEPFDRLQEHVDSQPWVHDDFSGIVQAYPRLFGHVSFRKYVSHAGADTTG